MGSSRIALSSDHVAPILNGRKGRFGDPRISRQVSRTEFAMDVRNSVPCVESRILIHLK